MGGDGARALGPDELEALVERLPALDWTDVERVEGLDDLLRIEAVKMLREGMLSCGFPRISTGWMAGAPMVSMTLKRARKADAAQEMNAATATNDFMQNVDARRALAEALQIMLCRAPANAQPEAVHVNALIEAFARRTGVALCKLQWNARSQAVRAEFGPLKIVDDRLSGRNLWRYSPSYQRFFTSEPPREYLGNVADIVASEVVESVWRGVTTAHYVVDANLREVLHAALLDYVAGGIDGAGEAFEPSTLAGETLAMYLHGTAGVGKSTFVELIGRALEGGLQTHVNPSLRVHVVKVPVNSMRPEHLQHILRIQGISDWSVERMVEQSIAKEHLAILHLEEHPEDPAVQRQVFDLVQGMVDHLVSKYPDRRGHMIFAWTSNYTPCEHMQPNLRVVVPVRAPDHDAQFRWAREMLEEALHSRFAEQDNLVVHVDDDARPDFCCDMRPLNSWWRSVSFFAAELVADLAGRKASGSASMTICVKSDDSAVEGHSVLQVVASDGAQTEARVKLSSVDSFFFCPMTLSPLQAVLQMGLRGFCTPTVVLVDQSSEDDDKGGSGTEHLTSLREALCAEARAGPVNEDIHLRWRDLGILADEQDKEKIYGDASEIRGGLYQFIDDTNNPNVRFMLRELLETSARSRTHRFSVSKRHVFFFLVAVPGEPVSEQTRSRAHLVIKA
ncbi:Hypothetical Protein FCC1311_013212 [Hondaea fermentalgiana]|uniref:Uncharacterized protein n=1 Tax=Hondaea fermentalgiana TaxID=2315210 RepID=A0A2R5GBI5_9STRA|nr:Hypothetical Protein FCC1311_013212 [Hondaea fermentalgiana]|eukprot:GBG25104.1 Hypothetical Protein FCC1311_013212 [Hondaea fermentalgiana]